MKKISRMVDYVLRCQFVLAEDPPRMSVSTRICESSPKATHSMPSLHAVVASSTIAWLSDQTGMTNNGEVARVLERTRRGVHLIPYALPLHHNIVCLRLS